MINAYRPYKTYTVPPINPTIYKQQKVLVILVSYRREVNRFNADLDSCKEKNFVKQWSYLLYHSLLHIIGKQEEITIVAQYHRVMVGRRPFKNEITVFKWDKIRLVYRCPR